MKYAVKMGVGVMIYIPSFCKDWFRYSTVDRGLHRHADSVEIA
jgi:hypothetical protein